MHTALMRPDMSMKASLDRLCHDICPYQRFVRSGNEIGGRFVNGNGRNWMGMAIGIGMNGQGAWQ